MKVSVVIPCYNHNDVVRVAIDSALRQTYVDKEVIVVDDGSDTPVAVPGGVRLIRHDRNRGLPAALNTGIRASTGERFVILAADDKLHQKHLEKTSRFDADIVSVDMLVDGEHVKTGPGSLDKLKKSNCHSYAALIKRYIFDLAGGFKDGYTVSWEDWDFFLTCAEHGAIWHHVPEPLHLYNRNPYGRDVKAQGKERLLWGQLHGYHPNLYGPGMGLVTCIVPCYKHEKFVSQAVQSVINQTYPHTNCIVVDDGSPGDVPGALRDLQNAEGRVFVLRQKNGGLSAARNAGISYALNRFNSQYMFMLDADDEVDPAFVEETMPVLVDHEYVYTDLKFIGDAWHGYELEDYNCERLTVKHIHACTFLMHSDMWRELVHARGYGYDPDMRKGWEDWEFALACAESGWCGHRLPKDLFHYRYHNEGSMRTEAGKIGSQLSKYIRDKHPWMTNKEMIKMACKTCGGAGRFTSVNKGVGKGTKGATVFIPGVGECGWDEQLLVLYTGPTTSTIKKTGLGGTLYKYSADRNKQHLGYGPVFTIFARDANLFTGPYKIKKMSTAAVASVATIPPVPQQSAPAPVEVVDIRQEAKLAVIEVVTDEPIAPELFEEIVPVGAEEDIPTTVDFTALNGVSRQKHTKLVENGFVDFRGIANADIRELASVLRVSKITAKAIKEDAAGLVRR